ncbi:hypothetical protein EQV77_06950 [Halobacillus fulvus]|nr:hypothetical protein EQV77_06950 [Halobacillus fulvus]
MDKLSKKSERFLDSLQLYLASSGKKEAEAKEIVEELRDHLTEAEQRGKSVEEITGDSPKAYMEQLSKEVSFDFVMVAKAIGVILFGAVSLILLTDVIDGGAELSLIQIIGYPVLFIAYVLSLAMVFRYLAVHQLNKKKEMIMLGIFSLVKGILFIAIITIDRVIESPVIILSTFGNLLTALLAVAFIVGASIWAKSWIMIVVALLLTLPELVISFFDFTEETGLIMKSGFIFGGMILFLWITHRREKAKEAA